MKTLRLAAASLFFAALFAVSAFAQTPAKFGLIDTSVFDDDKVGISKYKSAMTSLEAEFKKDIDDFTALQNKLQALSKELGDIDAKLKDANPKIPIDRTQLQTQFQTKYVEFERMKGEVASKKQVLEYRIEERRTTVLGAINQDIKKALQDYQKQKGYTVIFDASTALAWEGAIDITKDFTTFYNARATTATTTTTK